MPEEKSWKNKSNKNGFPENVKSCMEAAYPPQIYLIIAIPVLIIIVVLIIVMKIKKKPLPPPPPPLPPNSLVYQY